jgi:hypothetical protein
MLFQKMIKTNKTEKNRAKEIAKKRNRNSLKSEKKSLHDGDNSIAVLIVQRDC